MSKSIQETVECPECGQPLALVSIKKYPGSKFGLKRDFLFDILWYCFDCKEHGETIARGGWIMTAGLTSDELMQVREYEDREMENLGGSE